MTRFDDTPEDRDAVAAFKRFAAELGRDSPGKRWLEACPWKGRDSITRLLGVEGRDNARYACAPFKTIVDDDARPWIAGAIGIACCDNAVDWTHLDIRDVILWDPRSGTVGLVGQHDREPQLILPDDQGERLIVYGDPRTFFSAWAGARARWAGQAGTSVGHPIVEPRDSGIPGAFAIGDIAALPWGLITAGTLHASAGINKGQLQRAVIAAAHLPVIDGGDRARG